MDGFRIDFIVNALLFAVCGVALFVGSLAAAARIMPFNPWVEIGEKQNVALAVAWGAVALGLSLIIAAAVH